MAMDVRAGERSATDLPVVHLCTIHLELARPIVMAGGRDGARLYEGVLAGVARGTLSGTIAEHSGCIDTTVHEDGWGDTALRLLLVTDDHAVVEIDGSGVRDVGPEQRSRLAVRFQAGHERYTWLRHVQAVAIATPGRNELTIEVHQLR